MTEEDVAVGGTTLHARVDGRADGPVVALVNALATDLTMWDPQIPALAPNYRVLRFDARGHGRSAPPAGPLTMDALVDDLLGLLAHFGAERFCVVGLSLGGLVALATALRKPAGLAGIAVCDARADMPPEFQKGIDDRNALVRDEGLGAIADGLVERWFTTPTLARKPAYLAAIRRMVRETSVEGFTGCAEAIKGAGLRPLIGDIMVPTLFVVGDEDAALPVELAREMQAEVRGARIAEIAQAGHLSNVEQPGEFNAALLGFLGSVL